MKKKSPKKLRIGHIRIASLSASVQQQMKGDAYTAVDCPSGLATCATCGGVCGTRLC
ncbi:hypothetical protein HGH92_29450 [Chitinophaga varians]|uniref:Uncharacterized protein n=1 Tax=Chitinophaga varians TaxID=2202339 RepID=A0A847S5W8_9BACT|nr:hypothetical protein [Chitinophaga varians]NLR68468.1 hypothetical protein [Chitinophaga varians]